MKKFRPYILLLILLIGILSIPDYLLAQEIILPDKGICAHRGAMSTHPENTIESFKEAVRLQAQMMELDVRMTKDRKLVILHDESVDRTTNGTGKIQDLSLKQVKKLDAGKWKSPEFANVRIPTLSEALAVMPDDIWLNIHLKGGEELGKAVAKILVREKRLHQAFLACGAQAAAGAKQISPDILICNMDRQTRTEDYVSETIENGSEFIQLLRIPIGPEIMRYTKNLKSNNVKTNYCCTDSPDEIKQLFEKGVDFVLVNDLDAIMKAKQKWEVEAPDK